MNQNNLQNPNDVPASAPSPKPHKKKLFLWVVIAVIVGILALAGFLLWQMQTAVAPTSQSPPPPAPTPSPSPQPQEESTINNQQSEVDTSDWQTYRNDEYGFELKYPTHAFVKEVLDPANYFDRSSFLVLYIDAILDQATNLPTSPPEGRISFLVDESATWLEHCLQSEVTSKDTPDEIKEINGIELAVFDESSSASGGLRSLEKSYRTIYDNKCYRIQSSVTWRDVDFYLGATAGDSASEEETSEQQALIQAQAGFNNEILSTFRFVEEGKGQSFKSMVESLPFCTSSSDPRMQVSINLNGGGENGVLLVCNATDYVYVLREHNEKYSVVWEHGLYGGIGSGSLETPALRVVRTVDVHDVNGDGIDEIYWEGGTWSGSCGCLIDYKILYSLVEEEVFYKEENACWDEMCSELTENPPVFSSNLENEEYAIFKEYLTNKE